MDPSLVAGAGSSQSESTVLEATDQADEILQQPVRNIDSTKLALSTSTKRVGFIKTHTVQESITKYPYLRNPKLVSKKLIRPHIHFKITFLLQYLNL